MKEFLNIFPSQHEEAIRQVPGKLYVLYYSTDCVFCRQAVLELIRMPENSLFTYAVCQVDGEKDFRMKENLLSMPTVRIYEDGRLLRETNGYSRTYGAAYDMRGSIEKSEDYHLVYADNAATAKMSKKALKAYCDCAKNHYGNPSTAYEVGMDARGYLDQARSVMRTAFNLKGGSNIFTSGGSACNTGSVTPSHVLLALGLSEELAESAVRISLTRTIPRRTPTTS